MGLLKKYITDKKDVIISVVDATDAVSESMGRLGSYPPATAHLGQGIMGAALLQSLWNEKGNVDKVGLQWRVDGPFGHLYAESQQDGSVRGTILKPQAPIDNYETSLGAGSLQVQKHLSNASPSLGLIEAKGFVSEDLSEYLSQSEQRHSVFSSSVKINWNDENSEFPFEVDYAVAYLVDILPHPDKVETEKKLLEWQNYLDSLGPISEWSISKDDSLSSMIHLLNPSDKAKELMFQKVFFQCNCSQERASRAAELSNSDEEFKNAPKDETLEVQCEFCGQIYRVG